MCGEHMACSLILPYLEGSSPHVRGTRRCRLVHRASSGIIPACAGNTGTRRPRTASTRDHPRMCGEHALVRSALKSLPGSSPHVRGTLGHVGCDTECRGIIPACAGNTMSANDLPVNFRDHPRMCGEHVCIAALYWSFRGSSPHVRGTHVAQHATCSTPGIIPACAGNTPWSWRSPGRFRDHPRMCGEHLPNDKIGAWNLGSSPHVRGTPGQGQLDLQGLGIIPACAGNTKANMSQTSACRDHPRMCGEHCSHDASVAVG